MAHGMEDITPRKRRRMAGPDGFKQSSLASTRVKVSTPNFVSGFGNFNEASSEEKYDSGPLSKPSPKSSPLKPTISLKPLSASKPAFSTTLTINSPAKHPFISNLKARAPPDISLLAQKPKFDGRVLPPPVPPERSGGLDLAPLRKISRPSYAQPPVTPSKPTISLNSLVPPLPLVTPSSEHLLPISKTTIALATDLTTDNGTAELASIFLRDQHPNLPNQTSDEHDLRVGQSPERIRSYGVKGKEGFIRNGLAARASTLFTRSQNLLSLWQKEIELHVSSNHHLAPDLRATIVKVLVLPHSANLYSPTGSDIHTSISPGLALCQILPPKPSKSSRYSHILTSAKETSRHLIVLSFPSMTPSRVHASASRVRNSEGFTEGKELHMWEPWEEVSLDQDTNPAPGTPETTPFPILPSSFPSLSPTLTPLPEGQKIVGVILLCNRFRIVD